jgi:hypothetical protein
VAPKLSLALPLAPKALIPSEKVVVCPYVKLFPIVVVVPFVVVSVNPSWLLFPGGA